MSRMGKGSVKTDEKETLQDTKQSGRTPKLSDYFRVFSYATRWDFCVYAIASLASIGAGVTLPLMNAVFGQLTDQFTNYYAESSAMSRILSKVLDDQSELPVKAELSGSITIGGHNLEDLDLKWWRTRIGIVQQEPFLFNDTIFGNVANGLIATEWEDESEIKRLELVREACHEAHAHDFIDRLPDGYNTIVGVKIRPWIGTTAYPHVLQNLNSHVERNARSLLKTTNFSKIPH